MALGAQNDGAMSLDFELDSSEPGALMAPAHAEPAFEDDLWRHTCFELFAAGPVNSYREFNFSPSCAFAIYDFTQYREAMTRVDEPARPVIEAARGAMAMHVLVPRTLLELSGATVLSIGIAAVIEERGARLSYWALHHPGIKPDFHHRCGFVASWPLRSGCEERSP